MAAPLTVSLLAALIGAVLGAIAGSFASTIVVRWPRGQSVIGGRSACDGCGRTLRAADLVPLLSYFASGGRCRTCGAGIDRRHIEVEIACAGLGAVALLAQPGPTGLVAALLGWWLLVIAILDLEHHWLPDMLTLPLVPAGLVVGWLGIGSPVADRVIGMLAGFAALTIIRLGYRTLRGREGMGGGDPKFLAALGAWLGWHNLPLILLGAGLVGLLALTLKKLRGGRITATERLPLGTLMAIAAWPIWLLGGAV